MEDRTALTTVKQKIQRHKRYRLDASWFLLENPDYPRKAEVEEIIAIETIIIAHLKKVHKDQSLDTPASDLDVISTDHNPL